MITRLLRRRTTKRREARSSSFTVRLPTFRRLLNEDNNEVSPMVHLEQNKKTPKLSCICAVFLLKLSSILDHQDRPWLGVCRIGESDDDFEGSGAEYQQPLQDRGRISSGGSFGGLQVQIAGEGGHLGERAAGYQYKKTRSSTFGSSKSKLLITSFESSKTW